MSELEHVQRILVRVHGPLLSQVDISRNGGPQRSLPVYHSAAQRVLSLLDTLQLIFAHLPPPNTKVGRKSLSSAALTSRAMHTVAQPILWSDMSDLHITWNQIHFIFCASISRALRHSSELCRPRCHGEFVRILRLRCIPPLEDEISLCRRICTMCPNVQDLSIFRDLTPFEVIGCFMPQNRFPWLHQLERLERLSLSASNSTGLFSNTPLINCDSHDSKPYTRLSHFNVTHFPEYWPIFVQGLGPKLEDLAIVCDKIPQGTLVRLASKLSSLRSFTLRSRWSVSLEELSMAIAHLPHLQRLRINLRPDSQDYVNKVIQAVSRLSKLRFFATELTLTGGDLNCLTESKAPIEFICLSSLALYAPERESLLISLLQSKREWLKKVQFDFVDWHSVPFRPSTLLVQAFMGCHQLDTIILDDEMNASTEDISAESIDNLFKACPRLKPSFDSVPWAWGTEKGSRKYFHIFSLYPEVSDRWWKMRVAEVKKDGDHDSCWGLFF